MPGWPLAGAGSSVGVIRSTFHSPDFSRRKPKDQLEVVGGKLMAEPPIGDCQVPEQRTLKFAEPLPVRLPAETSIDRTESMSNLI